MCLRFITSREDGSQKIAAWKLFNQDDSMLNLFKSVFQGEGYWLGKEYKSSVVALPTCDRYDVYTSGFHAFFTAKDAMNAIAVAPYMRYELSNPVIARIELSDVGTIGIDECGVPVVVGRKMKILSAQRIHKAKVFKRRTYQKDSLGETLSYAYNMNHKPSKLYISYYTNEKPICFATLNEKGGYDLNTKEAVLYKF